MLQFDLSPENLVLNIHSVFSVGGMEGWVPIKALTSHVSLTPPYICLQFVYYIIALLIPISGYRQSILCNTPDSLLNILCSIYVFCYSNQCKNYQDSNSLSWLAWSGLYTKITPFVSLTMAGQQFPNLENKDSLNNSFVASTYNAIIKIQLVPINSMYVENIISCCG